MTPAMTKEQEQILHAVKKFTQAKLTPFASERDAKKEFPIQTLKEAGELGLGGIYVQDDFGANLTRQTCIAIFEELARGDTALAAYISIHNMVAWMIDQYGTEAQRTQWLPTLVSMLGLGSYCLTEPGTGSDAAAIVTRAVLENDEYVINGSKQFISGAGAAAVYIVLARTGGPGSSGISAFLVPANTPGLTFSHNENKMGWNTQPTRQVFLSDVRVSADSLLGVEGQGFEIAMNGLNGGRINIAACSLGGAQWALDQTVAYVKERHAFGKPLSDQQTVVFALADMQTKLRVSRAILKEAAESMDKKSDDLVSSCALAKRFVTDAAFEVANQALQLHGGYGYLHEYGIERVVRDLRVHQILEGTNEIMSLIVGRDLLSKG